VPWIGEGRSADEIADELEGQVSRAEVYFVLGQVEKKGYLCGSEGPFPPPLAAFWSGQNVDPGDASRRLGETPVAVKALDVDAGPLRALLEANHVTLGDEGRLDIVLTDRYVRPELAEYNGEALRRERPWLLSRPIGRQIWVGPLFVPGATGCWECLAQRLRANSPVESYLASRTKREALPAADLAASPATLQVAWGLVANAVANWVAQGKLAALEGKIQAFDPISWTMQSHTLVRLPHCPACGAKEAEGPRTVRQFVLETGAKAFTGDGGHRVVAPEVTLERYGHHVSSITGAVTMLERIGPSAGDDVMHVYVAGHNLARGHRSLANLRGDLRNMSSGKGATDAQARASGLCEGLERYSAVFRGDEPRRKATFEQLGSTAIALNECLLFSGRQFREREAWNARKSHYNFVPAPLALDAETDWSPVWSLTRGEPVYLPTAFCYFNYPLPPNVELFCISDSNGNAAGNTREEAVLQGFLELVERDAVALWWYNRVARPGVDLENFADPYILRVRDQHRKQGRSLWALDLTSDLGVPVFAALSRETEGPEERIVLGFGAHLDARLALLRAVTELNQMMTSLPDTPIDPKHPGGHLTDEETLQWLKTATIVNQPYLSPLADSLSRTAATFPQAWTDDIAEDVRACQALVERHGLEMLVLDQTRAEIGLPVMKVIVPGLRHFWARFAAGRLYDVPVRLGWLPTANTEDSLNPISMFL
jgi:ribosomal protein S12 methylthiotransferase accessory factor